MLLFWFCFGLYTIGLYNLFQIDGWKLILASFNLGIFPVFYWFSFLYYTDVLSTLLVLIMMLLHIHKAPNFAAVMGNENFILIINVLLLFIDIRQTVDSLVFCKFR